MPKFIPFLLALACVSPLAAQERNALDSFKALDSNKDGKVTKQEAGKAWPRFQRMDADGDGSVTLEEFQSSLTRQTRPGGAPASFSGGVFKNDKKDEISYSWFAPKIPKDARAPLVLCLHGAGGNTAAAQVLASPKIQDKYPCFIMAPACAKSEGWANTDAFARQRERERLPIVVEAIQSLLKKEAIDPNRIYVTGQSLGGIGTWGALARYPDLFAAGVPVCGAWSVKDVDKLVKTPVWAFHGDSDTTVPTKFSREMTSAINKAGGKAKYTEFPKTGHGSWVQAYGTDELWPWLFEQRLQGKE